MRASPLVCRMLGSLLAVWATLAPAAPGPVTRLELEASGEGARLTLELPLQARYHLFTLTSPDRVVLDLDQAGIDARRLALPAPAGSVRAVRVGSRAADGVRIVLEVSHAVVPVARMDSAQAGRARLAVSWPEASRPAPVRALPGAGDAREILIAVDAGHGGEDPGATGHLGTHEKDVTLSLARVLARGINDEPGMRAVLIRGSDVFVPLRARMEKAREVQADLFLSIHADAVADRSITGASVYVLSAHGASSEAAHRLAERENAADLVGGVSLRDKDPLLRSVLLDLSQSAAMSASVVAARDVLVELDQVGDVRKSEVQQAGFVVLKSPDIPSMLIETAYITNPAEERRLRDPGHQARIAEAILAGLKTYFRDHPPAGARLAARVPDPAGALARR